MSLALADGLTPIGLDDLTAQASLLTRVDRKYVLTREALDRLDLTGAAVLTIDGRSTFAYRSTYFDTPDLDAYLSAGRRRRRRFKVRTREYLDTGTTWLEVKTRGPRGTTVKERITHRDPDRLGDAGLEFVTETLAAHHVPVDAAALAPTLRTAYHRTTLALPATGDRPTTRATIDEDLAFTDLASGIEIGGDTLADLVIVETKGLPAPSALDRDLWRARHRPSHMSKYGVGLAALRPDLPALKWASTLDATYRLAA